MINQFFADDTTSSEELLPVAIDLKRLAIIIVALRLCSVQAMLCVARTLMAHKTVDATSGTCFFVGMEPGAFEVEIAQGTPADVGVAAPLFDAYRQFYGQPSNPEAARRFLFARLSNGESILFLAFRSQAAVGFVHLYPVFSSIHLTRQWILNDLYVVPEARKRGVGYLLTERARQLAESTRSNGLMLETAADNYTAQRLYERLGWKRNEEFYRYYLAV